MTTFQQAAVAVCALGFGLHLVTMIIAIVRCRPPTLSGGRFDWPSNPPSVAVLRPVRGIDQHDEMTLRSSFALDYPNYELVFCCADAADPVVGLLDRLMAEHPDVSARLLIGDDRSTPNPKLNNIIKGWQATRQDWVVLADCNVLMPPDYLQRMLGHWDATTGLVCSPPVGCSPEGFGGEVECAFLNTYQVRWQYAADTIGFGFAQGKSMLWRRDTLDRVGGIRALGAEIAEDAAATKVVRRQSLHVRLVGAPFEQPLGRRSWRQLWDRQVRWARLRRVTFANCFAPEIVTTSIVPIAAGGFSAAAVGFDVPETIALLMVIWYGSEAVLARSSGWHLTLVSPLAWIVRDFLIPVFWIAAWTGNTFTWRGNDMSAKRAGSIAPYEDPAATRSQ